MKKMFQKNNALMIDFVQNFLLKELDAGKALIYTSHIDCEIESKVLNL